MSSKAMQILSRRVHGINRIHTHSQRPFHKWRHTKHLKRRLKNYYGWNHNHFRHHGHWGYEPRVIYKYYKHPLSYAGTSLAMIISYNQHQSILWALISGCFSWFYVAYFAFENYNKQDKSAKDLLHNEVDELSQEIEKLNKIYSKLQGAVKKIKHEHTDEISVKMEQLNKSYIKLQSAVKKIKKEHIDELPVKIERLNKSYSKLQREVKKIKQEYMDETAVQTDTPSFNDDDVGSGTA